MSRPGDRWSRRRAYLKARAGRRANPPPSRLHEGIMKPQTKKTSGIRHELVSRIRYEIATGVYDSPAKLETALERLLSRLADD
jgi:hypothetical protein